MYELTLGFSNAQVYLHVAISECIWTLVCPYVVYKAGNKADSVRLASGQLLKETSKVNNHRNEQTGALCI